MQPLLINQTVSYVGLQKPNQSDGKGLIGAWALVFIGIAVRFYSDAYSGRYNLLIRDTGIQFCVQVPKHSLRHANKRRSCRTHLPAKPADTCR